MVVAGGCTTCQICGGTGIHYGTQCTICCGTGQSSPLGELSTTVPNARPAPPHSPETLPGGVIPTKPLRYRVYRCCKTCGKWEARNLSTHYVEYRGDDHTEALSWARVQLRDAAAVFAYTITGLEDLKRIRWERALPGARKLRNNAPPTQPGFGSISARTKGLGRYFGGSAEGWVE